MQISRIGLTKCSFSESVRALFQGEMEGYEGVKHGLDVAVAKVLAGRLFE